MEQCKDMSQISTREQVQKHTAELLGQSFQFRPGQLDAIVKIVENAIGDVKHTLLEAPTGSGKSIVALIAAYVLYQVHGKTSYILVSDLSLFKQYEDTIQKIGSNLFGCLKGKENYTCYKNGCNVSQSTCSLMNISPKAMFGCRDRCYYAKQYAQAVNAPITLMTYQLYFIQRNYVEDCLFNGHNKNFPSRDLVIADECHKISDICQAHFAPKMTISRPQWMIELDSYFSMPPREEERISVMSKIELAADNDEMVDGFREYESYVSRYTAANTRMRQMLASRNSLSKRERRALAAGNRARQEHCKLEDMLGFIGEYGSTEFVAKSMGEDDITLNFIFDDALLKKYFHKKSRCELLMSATIGNFGKYADLIGLDKKLTQAIQMKSTFDFSRSPIFFSTSNKMSYQHKSESLVDIAKQVGEICSKHATHRGIIQTGSYANANALLELLPREVMHRCIVYNGSSDKKDALDAFMMQDGPDNSILVGPTLMEGLNFPDDMCRFQICIKVPYACLGSEYVLKKMQHIDGWYEYDVLNKICQSIGRGVRHEKDWCETYILDGCVDRLVGKLMKFPVLNGRFKQM